MLFNNKITTNKGLVKAYEKGREIIDSKVNESSFDMAMQERDQNLHESFFNRPTGRAALRRRTNARKFQAKTNITKKLFMENFFDLYKQCLLLDEDFISRNDENLFNLCENTFTKLMDANKISWNSIKNESSDFIKNLYMLCEETAEKNATMNVSQDTVKKKDVSDEAIINEKEKDEEVDEKDKEKIDDETKDSKKKVSKVVKDKVVDTLKKEKESSEKEEEEEEEIKEKSKTKKEKEEDEAKEDEETPEEGEGDLDDSSEVDETKDENNSEEGEEDSSKEEDTDEEKSKDNKSESVSLFRRLQRPNKIRNNSLFRSIQLNVSNKAIKEKALNESVSINMDMIFAESLAYYTLLETLSTTGIIKMDAGELREVCNRLILK